MIDIDALFVIGQWMREEKMTRLEDMLPPGTEAEWSCGHVGGAMCAECYRQLAARAHELAEANDRLEEENRLLRQEIREMTR